MTEAVQVYQRAIKLIEKARLENWEELSFPRELYETLTEIPHTISTVVSLQRLDISQTSAYRLPRLGALQNLEQLDASTGSIEDISEADLPENIKKVWLNSNGALEDISALWHYSLLEGIDLDNTSVTNIEALATLKDLKTLRLKNTLVWDLSPLQHTPALERLDLSGSDVIDLSPLVQLYKLMESPNGPGLTFENCKAAKANSEIAKIAAIENSQHRAATLFDYLLNREPKTRIVQPDPIHKVELEHGALEVAASCPTAAEHEDFLKRSMHSALPDILERLATAAGNQFPRLSDAARRMMPLLDGDFETLDMARIHLAMNALRAAEKIGIEEGISFPENVAVALSEACDAGSGLTVDHPTVALLMERARKARDNPDPQEDTAAQDAMSKQFAREDTAIGPRLAALEAQVHKNSDPQAREAQKAVNRNVLWRIAIATGGFSSLAIGSKVVGDVLGQPIVDFVMNNLPILKNAALTYGPVFADWFLSSLAKCQEFAGVIASLSADSQLHVAKKRLERSDT